jgi:hypothetical protein
LPLLAAALLAASPLAGRAATPLAATGAVRVVSQSARWTGLVAIDALGAEPSSMFLISGELENAGTVPLTAVKLVFELLEETSSGDVVVASEYGYNFRAEALRGAAAEAGELSAADLHIVPLTPGARDMFRMTFFRQDVPRFDHWRVTIVRMDKGEEERGRGKEQ